MDTCCICKNLHHNGTPEHFWDNVTKPEWLCGTADKSCVKCKEQADKRPEEYSIFPRKLSNISEKLCFIVLSYSLRPLRYLYTALHW